MDIDVPTFYKWIEDVETVQKNVINSFVLSHANAEQKAAYAAAMETLDTLRSDLRKKVW